MDSNINNKQQYNQLVITKSHVLYYNISTQNYNFLNQRWSGTIFWVPMVPKLHTKYQKN